MKNGKLEKLIKTLNEKVDRLLEDICYVEEVSVETDIKHIIRIDAKSYNKICKYLETDDISLMGIS